MWFKGSNLFYSYLEISRRSFSKNCYLNVTYMYRHIQGDERMLFNYQNVKLNSRFERSFFESVI